LRRLIITFVALVVALANVSCVYADSSRYCPRCLSVTTWEVFCPHLYKFQGNYMQHETSTTTVCNYYYKYYRTQEKCQTCHVNVYEIGTHKEIVVHECWKGTQSECPY